jgi:hypothetical protein
MDFSGESSPTRIAMAKIALILLVMAGLIFSSGPGIGAHDQASVMSAEIHSVASHTDGHSHSHDDETVNSNSGHHQDHDPADHSHQVMFAGPTAENQFLKHSGSWNSGPQPDISAGKPDGIDRPPQNLLLG